MSQAVPGHQDIASPVRNIYDHRGQVIPDTQIDEDSGIGLNETFRYTLTYSGWHYISVNSWEEKVPSTCQ